MKTQNHQFMDDLEFGLTQTPKSIPCKYFYDKRGCELYDAITRHEDYYLTQCEIEILTTNVKKLSGILSNESFNLIELGPGEGIKSQIIINQLIQGNSSFTYIPVDISKKYLQDLSRQLLQLFPSLKLKAIEGDWIEALKKNELNSSQKNLLLFLGSSIGNYSPNEIVKFLHEIVLSLKSSDYLLIGFDLCKDPQVLLRAYDDSSGLTRQFNFNLLERINNELGGDFDLSQFVHRPRYNVATAAVESFLVSRIKQCININSMQKTFYLDSNEEIHVESSYKFTLDQIEQFAELAGCEVIENFMDSKEYFVSSLWRIVR